MSGFNDNSFDRFVSGNKVPYATRERISKKTTDLIAVTDIAVRGVVDVIPDENAVTYVEPNQPGYAPQPHSTVARHMVNIAAAMEPNGLQVQPTLQPQYTHEQIQPNEGQVAAQASMAEMTGISRAEELQMEADAGATDEETKLAAELGISVQQLRGETTGARDGLDYEQLEGEYSRTDHLASAWAKIDEAGPRRASDVEVG